MFYAVRLSDEKIMEFKTNKERRDYVVKIPCYYKQKVRDKNHIKLLYLNEKMS